MSIPNKVTNVYQTSAQIEEAKNLARDLSSMNVKFNAYQLDFSAKGLSTNNGGGLKFNPDMSIYKTDGGYTKESVFVGFLKSFSPRANDGGATKLTEQIEAYSVWNMQQERKDIELIKEPIAV